VSEFKDGDDQFKVLLRLDEPYRNLLTMGDLLVAAGPGQGAPGAAGAGAGGGGGGRVKVSDVAQLKNDYGPASIDRYNRQRQISVNANLQGVPLGEVLANARAKVEELHLKPGTGGFGGSARTLAEASTNFTIALVWQSSHLHGAGVAVQQLHHPDDHDLPAAQPASQPAGAHGVRDDDQRPQCDRVDDAVRHREEELDSAGGLYEHAPRTGMERHEALIAANHVRLRPILMTTIAIVAGMIPSRSGRGPGRVQGLHGGDDSGRPGAVPPADPAGHPVVCSYFDDLREWSPARRLAPRGRSTGPAAARAPVRRGD
jgi:HAE1 family hydrophobic/amphiphilic exporter-1